MSIYPRSVRDCSGEFARFPFVKNKASNKRLFNMSWPSRSVRLCPRRRFIGLWESGAKIKRFFESAKDFPLFLLLYRINIDLLSYTPNKVKVHISYTRGLTLLCAMRMISLHSGINHTPLRHYYRTSHPFSKYFASPNSLLELAKYLPRACLQCHWILQTFYFLGTEVRNLLDEVRT